MKLREISLYRPFGFRGHHAVSYQASPAVAAMFPRLVGQSPAQNQAGQSLLDGSGRLMQAGRPSILRHMTPIRATINEGQRLIAQMLPHQLADHLGHYHRYYHHQYPTHSNMGTLPIPPMRQHHLMSHPMRRNQAPAALDRWHPTAKRQDKHASNHASQSRMRVRHMEPDENEELSQYELANEFDGDHNQLVQLGDELAFASPAHREQPLLEDAQFEHQTGQLHLMPAEPKNSRPGRQMLSPAEQQRRVSSHRMARLRVDRPSIMVQPITQPCIPVQVALNGSTSTTTQAPTTQEATNSINTTVLETNRTSSNSTDFSTATSSPLSAISSTVAT